MIYTVETEYNILAVAKTLERAQEIASEWAGENTDIPDDSTVYWRHGTRYRKTGGVGVWNLIVNGEQVGVRMEEHRIEE